jgi:hypothetical protein
MTEHKYKVSTGPLLFVILGKMFRFLESLDKVLFHVSLMREVLVHAGTSVLLTKSMPLIHHASI